MTVAAIEPATRYRRHQILVNDPDAWNEWIAGSSAGHVLQSFEWGECKRQFGWSVERFALVDGAHCLAAAQVLCRPTALGPIAYIPRGPITCDRDDPSLAAQLLAGIHRTLRRRRAIFLRVEPNQATPFGLEALGFTRAPASIQADVTIHVDLTPDLEGLLAAVKPKTRYNIRLAQRRGVQVTAGTFADLGDFYRLLKETSRRDTFYIRSFDYYRTVFATLGDKCRLLLAHHDGELLAAAFVTLFGSEAIYLYGASSGEKRNLMPTYLLQWEAMKLAKVLGCSRYDFWGIPALVDPETGRPLDPDTSVAELGVTGNGLWGVYRFKQGFGGHIVGYDGAWDHVYSPVRYRLWSTLLPAVRRVWAR